MQTAYQAVTKFNQHKMNIAKIHHDRHVSAAKFQKGDHVWNAVKSNKTGKAKKLRPRWQGPYIVTDTYGDGTYMLKQVNNKKGKTITANRLNLKRCFMRTNERKRELSRDNNETNTINGVEISRFLDIDFFERESIEVNEPRIIEIESVPNNVKNNKICLTKT